MRFSDNAAIETAPLRLEEVPDPEPGPGEVRVRVRVCGICPGAMAGSGLMTATRPLQRPYLKSVADSGAFLQGLENKARWLCRNANSLM